MNNIEELAKSLGMEGPETYRVRIDEKYPTWKMQNAVPVSYQDIVERLEHLEKVIDDVIVRLEELERSM